MNNKPKILGVVGARSGSKTLPDKNILPLLGRPMMGWIIEAAKRSKYIDRIVVSTDSEKYAEIAKTFGAEVPFLRPESISGDFSPDHDWLYHAATWLAEHEGWKADIIVRLPPTSPLCKTEDIDACIELLLNDASADASYTVMEAPKHPYKMWRFREDGYIEPFLSEAYTGIKDAFNHPRQILPPAYFYIDSSAIRWKTLVEDRSMWGQKVVAHHINEAIDIDVYKDFAEAERILRERQNKK